LIILISGSMTISLFTDSAMVEYFRAICKALWTTLSEPPRTRMLGRTVGCDQRDLINRDCLLI
jgi:hypothetical protein